VMLVQLVDPPLPKPAERDLDVHEKTTLIKEEGGTNLLEERVEDGLTQPGAPLPASAYKRSTSYSRALLPPPTSGASKGMRKLRPASR
jgi:hypothetical protein